MDGLVIVVLAFFEQVSSCVFCRFARFLSALVGCLAVVRRRAVNDGGVVLVMCCVPASAVHILSNQSKSGRVFCSICPGAARG